MRAGLAGLAAFACLAVAGVGRAEDPATAQQPVTDRKPTVEGAITSPVEDLNLKKISIPDVLTQAVANPYDMTDMSRCEAIADEVQTLNQALGADSDAPQVQDPTTAKDTAASLLKTGVQAVTPFRGIVRHLTGANAYERKVQEAVEAGFARRGFLKGRAIEMNCAPPASPAWFKPADPPPSDRSASATLAPEAPPLTLAAAPAPTN